MILAPKLETPAFRHGARLKSSIAHGAAEWKSRRPSLSRGPGGGYDSLGRLGAPGQNVGHPHDGEVLPVATLAFRILAAALLERDDLRAAGLLDDLADHARADDVRSADMIRL